MAWRDRPTRYVDIPYQGSVWNTYVALYVMDGGVWSPSFIAMIGGDFDKIPPQMLKEAESKLRSASVNTR